MSATTTLTKQAFRERVDIRTQNGFRLHEAFVLVFGDNTRWGAASVKMDENGLHVKRQDLNNDPPDGWEKVVYKNASDLMCRVRHLVSQIPDDQVADYANTAPSRSPETGDRGWNLIVDDKCLGACRVIPILG